MLSESVHAKLLRASWVTRNLTGTGRYATTGRYYGLFFADYGGIFLKTTNHEAPLIMPNYLTTTGMPRKSKKLAVSVIKIDGTFSTDKEMRDYLRQQNNFEVLPGVHRKVRQLPDRVVIVPRKKLEMLFDPNEEVDLEY